MKRLLFLVPFVFCIGKFTFAQSLDNTIFHPIEGTELSVTKAGVICSGTENIDISSLPLLTSIAVSGNIEFDDTKNGFVRVILIDKNYDEYLILEESQLFSTGNKFSFSPTCIETWMLDNIQPMSVKIICFHATASIDYMYYTESKSLLFDKDIEAKNHKQQVSYWCDLWNQYNKENHQYWYAQINETSRRYSFNQSLSNYGCHDDYIPDGLVLYAGGLFVIKNHHDKALCTARLEPKKTNANVTSNYVDSFDWRNRHGKNWITPVKDQTFPIQPNSIGNGGCWAFAACGTVESCYQLYFNRIVSLDLSEQELGSCTSGSLVTGGFVHNALAYIRNNGIMAESDFVFMNDSRIPCSMKNDTPTEVVSISNYGFVSCNEDSLKSA